MHARFSGPCACPSRFVGLGSRVCGACIESVRLAVGSEMRGKLAVGADHDAEAILEAFVQEPGDAVRLPQLRVHLPLVGHPLAGQPLAAGVLKLDGHLRVRS